MPTTAAVEHALSHIEQGDTGPAFILLSNYAVNSRTYQWLHGLFIRAEYARVQHT